MSSNNEIIDIVKKIKIVEYILQHVPCDIQLKENLDTSMIAYELYRMLERLDNATPNN